MRNSSLVIEKTITNRIYLITLKDKFKDLKKQFYRDRYLLLIFLIPLLYYIIFRYVPIYGIIIAFEDFKPFKGILGSPWVGFKHFQEFFSSVYFTRVLINTLLLSLYGIIFSFPVPIIFALLLNEIKNDRFKRTIQTVSYLPYFVSTVVVVGLVVNFLSPSMGIVNMIIKQLGFEPVYFMVKAEYFKPIYTVMCIWKSVGWEAILYIAALTTIDIELYEAAIIDGASKWKQLVHITLPGIIPTIVIMLIMRFGNILNVDFESIILLYNPSIYSSADVISTYVYRSGLVDGNFSFATAVGFFQNVIGFALIVITNKVSNNVTGNGLW